MADRRRSWLRIRAGLEVVALATALVGFSLWPLIRPATDAPAPADAVVVLSGDRGDRLEVAQSLIDRGLVRTLVFVGTPDRLQEDELCQTPGEVEYICVRPEPDNTRAEARAVGHLVESRGWRRVVVVTSRFHVTRARLLFRRCLDAEVMVMGGEPPYGRAELARQVRGEWPKVLYTVAAGPAC